MVNKRTFVRGRGSRGVKKGVVKKDILTGVVKKVPYWGRVGEGLRPLLNIFLSETIAGRGSQQYVKQY